MNKRGSSLERWRLWEPKRNSRKKQQQQWGIPLSSSLGDLTQLRKESMNLKMVNRNYPNWNKKEKNLTKETEHLRALGQYQTAWHVVYVVRVPDGKENSTWGQVGQEDSLSEVGADEAFPPVTDFHFGHQALSLGVGWWERAERRSQAWFHFYWKNLRATARRGEENRLSKGKRQERKEKNALSRLGENVQDLETQETKSYE